MSSLLNSGCSKTPVLFLIFNRPDLIAQVFNRIKQARPSRLYIAADGPRFDRNGEAALVQKARDCTAGIDWPCEVQTLFREENLGCGKAVSQAIDWFFEFEKEGIILEDDCLPEISFFSFCEKLLHRYREDERVMHISGNNFTHPQHKVTDSYYFSKYTHNWGWATWRRAWKRYDFEMKSWPEYRDSKQLLKSCQNPLEQRYWTDRFEEAFNKKVDTWDFQWLYACWANRGLSLVPAVNLVSNIGFSEDALHTKDIHSPLSNKPTEEIFKLTHPSGVTVNDYADRLNFRIVFLGDKQPSTILRVTKKILNLWKKYYRQLLFRKPKR